MIFLKSAHIINRGGEFMITPALPAIVWAQIRFKSAQFGPLLNCHKALK